MAQYRADTKTFDPTMKTRFEVMKLDSNLTPGGSLIDAFGRLRISAADTLFDCQNIHVESRKFDTKLTGGGTKTYLVNESSVSLSVNTALGDEVIRQTKRVMPYQPGKSLLILNTFVFNTPKEGLLQRVGYFNDQNGVFLENDGTGNYFVLRKYVTGAVTEIRIPQSQWNFDKFDGTGLSAHAPDRKDVSSLDVSKTNIFWVDVEWLGVGDVRCGFVVDGIPHLAHTFHNDNRNTTVYMTTACLPLRFEIKNTTAQASASTMKQICSSVVSEGGFQLVGINHGCGRGFDIATADTLTTAGVEYPMIAYRLRAGRTSSVVIPNKFHVYVDSNNTVSYRIYIGGTITNGSWQVRPTDSAVEYNTGAFTADLTNAELVQGGFVTGGSAIQSGTGLDNLNYQLQNLLDGTRVPVVLVLIPASNNLKVLTKADWVELV